MSRPPKPYTGKWLLLVCALTFFLLPSLSSAFGVSSSRALKLSQGEGMGRRRAQFLVAETTELVANAAAITVAGDTYWKQIGLAFVETGGAGGFATILAVLLGAIPLLEKAITGQAKEDIGKFRSEIRDDIRDLDTKVDSLKNEMKADSESLKNEIKTAVVVVPLLNAAGTVALVLWMMKTN